MERQATQISRIAYWSVESEAVVGAGGQVEQISGDHLNANPLVEEGGADVEVAGAGKSETHFGIRVQMLEKEFVHLHSSWRNVEVRLKNSINQY